MPVPEDPLKNVDNLSDQELVTEITDTLLRVLNRAQRDRPRRYVAGASMTLVESEVCRRIYGKPGIAATELSDTLAVTRSAMSQTLARLRERGFVDERPLPGNRRRKALTLTEAGESAVRASMRQYDVLAQDVYAEPRDELESYYRFVHKLERSQLIATESLLVPEDPG